MAKPVVLDTSVMIEHERCVSSATEYVSDLLVRGGAALHPVSRAELLCGARNRAHLVSIKRMMSPFAVLAIKNVDFADAIELLESNVLSSRVGWPDCLIASTCRRLGATLVTLNERDFRICPGLKVVRPY